MKNLIKLYGSIYSYRVIPTLILPLDLLPTPAPELEPTRGHYDYPQSSANSLSRLPVNAKRSGS